MNQRQFERRPSKPTANPRKVVGGVKLSPRKAGASASAEAVAGGVTDTPWVIQRWMRLVETYAPGDQLTEGVEYARVGQTRSLELGAGLITGRVQGRMPKAYNVTVRLPTFSEAQWPPVIEAMIAQARYAAALLSGEVPSNIEDLFIPVGLKLFPSEPSDVAVSCDCAIFTGKTETYEGGFVEGLANTSPAVGPGPAPTVVAPPAPSGVPAPSAPPAPAFGAFGTPLPVRQPSKPVVPRVIPTLPPGVPWCKHACCVMALVADRLATDPFMIFALRGLPPDELIDRLRQRRQAAGGARASGVASLVYESHLPGVSDRASKPLEQCIESFWVGGATPAATTESADSGASGGGVESERMELDLTIAPPEVSHPLLRRMGPSPFPKAKFPIVGLLATCYDLVSRDAIGEIQGPLEEDMPIEEPDDEQG